MDSVIISVSINDTIDKYKGLHDRDNSVLIYTDTDGYLNKLYLNDNRLERTKEDIEFNMYINDNSYIKYNTEYGKVDIPINVFYLKKTQKRFHLKYSIENEFFEYIVNIEKIVKKNVDFVSK